MRNTMGELEDAGLVHQPHISAGRVPTDQGYRFYVDNLLGVLTLAQTDLSFINEKLGIGSAENIASPERLMEKTSQMLSEISQNIGVVTSPTLANDKLQHIDFLNLSDKRILVVLVSAPNLVHNKVIRLRETFSPDELKRTASYLNREFAGKTLTEIRRRILALMHDEKTLFDRLLQTAIILCNESLEGETAGGVYVGGASNMLARSDFSNLERLREVLRTIEEKSRLVEILSHCIERERIVTDGVQVFIGRENVASSLQDCALIAAPYRVGNDSAVGTISVIGSMRIEYARMIAIVSYVAKTMEKLLLNEVLPPRIS